MNKIIKKIIENNTAREIIVWLATFIFIFIISGLLDMNIHWFGFILVAISVKVFIELLIYNVMVRMTLLIVGLRSDE